MNKKWVTIGVLGVLVLGGGYWTYKHFTVKPAVASNITAKAKMGSVKKVISATGTVNFPHSIPLQFSNKGQLVVPCLRIVKELSGESSPFQWPKSLSSRFPF